MWRDALYALRLLVRAPAFTLVAIVTLALGIGANTAIFSVVRSALLAPLPFREPSRLVVVWDAYPPALPRAAVSAPGYYDLRAADQLFEDVAAFRVTSQNITGNGEPGRLVIARTSQSFQPMLGLRLAIGRWFTAAEDAPGDSPVVVLSDALWRRRFGGDPRVLGQTLRLNDRPHEIIGVMSAPATFPRLVDAWVPIAFTAQQRSEEERGSEYLDVVGRLRPGLAGDRARTGLARLADTLRARYYADSPRWTLDMRPLEADLVRDTRPILLTVFGAVGLVLLVACANVANLLLARAGHRRRELAVRAAIGAARGRLLGQLLVETAILGGVGGAAGVILAAAAVPLLARAVAASFPLVDAPRLDVSVLAFALIAIAASSLLFGAIPAWQLSRTDLRSTLNEETRGGSGRRTGRLLVVAELALAFSVLAGAGLLVRSFARVTAVDPGFGVDHRLTLRVALPVARYAAAPERQAFYARLLDRVSALPGVRDAGVVSELPLGDMKNMGTFEIEGRALPRGADLPHGDWRSASPRYFAAIGIGLVAGRLFDEHDGADAPRVVIVDEAAAARYWPGVSAIGQRLSNDGPGAKTWREIIGVVRTVHHDALDEPARGTIYLPLAQRPTASAFIVVHADGDPLGLLPPVRTAVGAIDPELPLFDVRTLGDRLDRSLGRRRIATRLIGAFASLALALALVGVYGVISYDVSQREREIGIRMALGADRRAVLVLVLRNGAWMAAAGVSAGAALAVVVARLAGGLLFGVSALDPLTYIGVTAMLLITTIAAAWLPARRATALRPFDALR
jgi:putative ABC transport system permease protein